MNEELFVSREFTPVNGFTSGIEGPACDAAGNLYAVNYERQHTIGKVTPDGTASVFVELPTGSIGNGIRFNSEGFMFVADYTNHKCPQGGYGHMEHHCPCARSNNESTQRYRHRCERYPLCE